jgi:hypothetical protein
VSTELTVAVNVETRTIDTNIQITPMARPQSVIGVRSP